MRFAKLGDWTRSDKEITADKDLTEKTMGLYKAMSQHVLSGEARDVLDPYAPLPAKSQTPEQNARVPLVITKADEAKLRDLGYPQDQIDHMTPEEVKQLVKGEPTTFGMTLGPIDPEAYKKYVIDFTNGLNDVRAYIDGARVASGTTFNLSAITAGDNCQLMVQVQKTSGTNVSNIQVSRIGIQYVTSDGA